MTQITSISLKKHDKDFIQSLLVEGKYSNESEVVCAGLRLLEEEIKLQTLKKSIEEGIDTGRAKDFDPKKYILELKDNKRIL